MEIEIDLDNVNKFINNPEFHHYLVSNTIDLGTAVFILQTLQEKVKEIQNTNN